GVISLQGGIPSSSHVRMKAVIAPMRTSSLECPSLTAGHTTSMAECQLCPNARAISVPMVVQPRSCLKYAARGQRLYKARRELSKYSVSSCIRVLQGVPRGFRPGPRRRWQVACQGGGTSDPPATLAHVNHPVPLCPIRAKKKAAPAGPPFKVTHRD